MPRDIDQEQLRNWLVGEIRPICDADPTALAKYVVALVRKDKPEEQLKPFCVEQLEVFLQSKSGPFVDRLFDVISRGAYLNAAPQTASPPAVVAPAATAPKPAAAPAPAPAPVQQKQPSPVHVEKPTPAPAATSAPAEVQPAASTSTEPAQSRVPEAAPARLSHQNASPTSSTRTESNGSSRDRSQRKRVSPPRQSSRSPTRHRSRSPRDRRRPQSNSLSSSGGSGGSGGSMSSSGGSACTHRSSALAALEYMPGPRLQGAPVKIERASRTASSSGRSNESYRRRSRSRSRSPYERHERRREERDAQPARRRRCRDFDEMGYCTRGDSCSFDHGPDPVVMDSQALEKIGLSGMNRRPAPPVVDYSVPPPGYNPVNPPPPGVENTIYGAPSVPQTVDGGYNPEAPALTDGLPKSINFSVPPPMATSWNGGNTPYSNVSVVSNVPKPSNAYDPTSPSNNPIQQADRPQRPFIPGYRGRGRGGRYNQYLAGGRNGASTENASLQVRKIPVEFNNIAKLNEHFEQFGTIVNMQVKYQGDQEAALITYSSKFEADKAYKSTEPIFNNRFIRVFWHNEGGQAVNQVQSTPEGTGEGPANGNSYAPCYPPRGRGYGRGSFSSNRGTHQGSHHPMAPMASAPVEQPQPEPPVVPKKVTINPELAAAREKFRRDKEQRQKDEQQKSQLTELFKLRQELMDKQLTCQKDLFAKIKAEQNPEMRKKFMMLFKKCDTTVQTLKKDMFDLSEQIKELCSRMEERKKAHEEDEKKRKRPARGDDLEAEILGERPARDSEEPAAKKPKESEDLLANKRGRVVTVRGFPSDHEDDLISHLESFGELYDMEFNIRGADRIATFTYVKAEDAQKAYDEAAKAFEFSDSLVIEWAPVALASDEAGAVIPDEKRKPEERVTAAGLLAAIDDGENESDGSDS
uniref:C3H1-type domain-containing protein n=1 Tax=Steinernema glaseri TaxID=37863 RepID=A0A1I7YKW2_9BILA